MLHLDKITFAMEGRRLFDDATASVPTGHKVGLVGRNGTGKTTLFKLIRNELSLESGDIRLKQGARIGGVSQEAPASDNSLLDTVLAADTERAQLMERAQSETNAEEIAAIQTRLADIDAWSAEARASSILKGLGFDTDEQSQPCANFSGGWRMRVALAAVLFAQPDLLLLDEPTNYLDLEGALWLESYLARYPHTVLIVSHDRGLLNRAVDAILHLEDRKLALYQGAYDQFARMRAEKLAHAQAMAKKQDARRAHLQSYVDRFRYKADKAKQAQSRLKAIARLQPISSPEESALRSFSFPTPEALSPPIISFEAGATGYDGEPVLRRLNLRIDQDDRIALLGKNGQGKSTLSKLLAQKLPLMEGRETRASKLRIGYFAQHQIDELRADETPLEHLRRLRPAETPAKWRARLAGFGLGPAQAETVVKDLSGGQKARLSLLLATIDAPHLLILDEPTNHLDIESREALVEALTDYTGAVILVSHDMHLLGLVADRLWLVSNGSVKPFDEDLDAYRNLLVKGEERPTTIKNKKKKPDTSTDVRTLRSDLKRAEARIEKLDDMHKKLQEKLANPALYDAGRESDLKLWQDKYTEWEHAMERAEALWVDAQGKLDAADG